MLARAMAEAGPQQVSVVLASPSSFAGAPGFCQAARLATCLQPRVATLGQAFT